MTEDTPSPRIAVALTRLLELRRKEDGTRYSDQEIADWCRDQYGTSFSRTYVWMLRTGRRDKPTFAHIQALASFFDVPLEYFGDDDRAQQIEHELDLLLALRDSNARSLALRASGLSADATREVLRHIEQIRQNENHRREGESCATDNSSGGAAES